MLLPDTRAWPISSNSSRALENPIWNRVRAKAPYGPDGRLVADAGAGVPALRLCFPSSSFLRKFAGTEAQDLGEC